MSDRTAAIRLEYDALKSDYDKLEKENQKLNKKNKNYVKIIKSKQDKNKELEKQIEFYKNGFAELCEEYEGDGEWSFAEVKFWIDKQNEENKELEKQIEKNQERNKDLRDFRSVCDSLSLSELSADCLMKYINDLKKEGSETESSEEEDDTDKLICYDCKKEPFIYKHIGGKVYCSKCSLKLAEEEDTDTDTESSEEEEEVNYNELKEEERKEISDIMWKCSIHNSENWKEEEERQVIIGIECNKCKQVPYPLGHREIWCLYRYTDCSFCGEKKSLDFKWGKEGEKQEEE